MVFRAGAPLVFPQGVLARARCVVPLARWRSTRHMLRAPGEDGGWAFGALGPPFSARAHELVDGVRHTCTLARLRFEELSMLRDLA